VQPAITVLIEAIQRGRSGETLPTRARVRDLQMELRSLGDFMASLGGYFPQARAFLFDDIF
jgi:hypothetical protein